ncbi:MAG: ASKHA domain-containing protein [Lachnospiraceae bacterium]|nr:ASKHA domain-containing protein [Lachnospiraceae bacterium]
MEKDIRTNRKRDIGVAVDLGSTSIAVSCFDVNTKEELTSFSYTNPQTAYGADVMTRIKLCAGDEDMLAKLGKLVKESLKEQLMAHISGDFHQIKKIVYSGNTTMLHILQGLSVDGLAAVPFTPENLEFDRQDIAFGEVFGCKAAEKSDRVSVYYSPGFSAFVGADILTGVEFLKMGQHDYYDLLVDLGTNGEMVLLNRYNGYASSTACGCVFDSAVTGAVYGSECIKAIANCIKRNLIDENGMIAAPYFDKGIVIDKGFVIKQEHVRKFQLAKGAINAGITCLMERAGITADVIGNVYISGGLGFYMNVREAFVVKMLPKALKGKIMVSGNTSLEGAKKLLLADETKLTHILEAYEAIKSRTQSFELANFEGFQEEFMKALNF